MHARRLATFFFGLWLGAGLLMCWVAADSFRTAKDAGLRQGSLEREAIKKLGPAGKSVVWRLAAEQNARWFEVWETAELLMGALIFLYLLVGTRVGPFPIAAALLMTLITAAQRFFVTPVMLGVMRTVDLATLSPAAGAARKFQLLHFAYCGMEGLKYVVCLAAVIHLSFSWRRLVSGEVREEINLIDKANYGHVDR